jgi:ABC-type amino acid transport substrate-binding protein
MLGFRRLPPFSGSRSLAFGLGAVLAVAGVAGACAAQAEPGPVHTPAGAAVTEVVAEARPGPVVATSFREARDAGQARITFYFVPAAGFAYRDEAGSLTGVTVELLRDFARHVADTHGIALEVAWKEEPRWADFYRHVRDSRGGVFGIGNVTITEARRQELDFSPPYLHNIAVLVTHRRVPELASMEQVGTVFRDLTALPFPGTLHEARLEALRTHHLPEMPTRPVASNDELVSLVASDRGYFGYLDIYNYWRARQADLPLRRHPVGDDGSEAFGVILPHGSDWTPVMEAFFQAGDGYTRSARFREHMRRHLGEELASLLAGG